MKGDPEFLVLKHTAWLDTATFELDILGAIIKEVLSPTDYYEPDKPLRYYPADAKFVEGQFDGFLIQTTSAAQRSASGSLRALAGFSFSGSRRDEIHLAGKLIRWKRLTRLDRFWPLLRSDPAVSREVPDWVGDSIWPVCLVVGVMICEDVDLTVKEERESKLEAHLAVPALEIASAAAGNPAAAIGAALGGEPGAGDPEIKAHVGAEETRLFKGKMEGSKIFALELKEITTPFLRRTKLKITGRAPKLPGGKFLGQDDNKEEAVPVTLGDMIVEDLLPVDLADLDACLS